MGVVRAQQRIRGERADADPVDGVERLVPDEPVAVVGPYSAQYSISPPVSLTTFPPTRALSPSVMNA
jgi:hypothetical protein